MGTGKLPSRHDYLCILLTIVLERMRLKIVPLVPSPIVDGMIAVDHFDAACNYTSNRYPDTDSSVKRLVAQKYYHTKHNEHNIAIFFLFPRIPYNKF